MQSEQFDIVEAAGLDPELFDVGAWAPACDDLDGTEHPALLVGEYRGHRAAIRAEPRTFAFAADFAADAAALTSPIPTSWDAVAFVSRHPGLALNELTEQERERLRAEKLTPAGMEGPVGQAKVIDQPEARRVPDPPPPIIPPAAEASAVDGIDAAPADCGGAECIVFQGPEGVQEVHAPNTCPKSSEADRG